MTGTPLLLVFTAATLAVTVAFASLRRRPIGRDLSSSLLLSTLLLAGAAGTVSWNAVRASTSVTVGDIFLVLAAASLLPKFFDGARVSRAVPLWIIVGGGTLVLAVLLSSLTNLDAEENLIVGARFILAMIIMPAIFGLAGDSFTQVRFLARTWVWSVALSSLLGVLDLFTPTDIGYRLTGAEFFGRAAGLTVHPNHLAVTVVMAMPVALALDANVRSKISRLAGWVLVLLLLLGVLVSGSRAGILVVALAGILTVVAGDSWIRRRVLLMGGVWLVGILGPALYYGQAGVLLIGLRRLLGSVSTEDSNVERIAFLRTAMRDITEAPFLGAGFARIRDAHDLYLQLWHGGGLLTFVAFLVFASGTLWWGVRTYSTSDRITPDHRLLGSFVVSMAVWLALGLVQNQVYDRYLYMPAALLLCWRSAARRAQAHAQSPVQRTRLNQH